METLPIIQRIAIWAIPVLFAITVHEVAHGWVASKLGDQTARMMGRLTLNPIKHIDIIGTIVVPVVLLVLGGFILGWAKPVPVNWNNLKNPRRDMALVAAAGPVTNLIMALIWAVIAKLGISLGILPLSLMGQAGILINLILMVLNLIPLPPLDGSRVVTAFLSGPAAYAYNRIEPYGFFILLALLVFGLLHYILVPPVMLLTQSIFALFGL